MDPNKYPHLLPVDDLLASQESVKNEEDRHIEENYDDLNEDGTIRHTDTKKPAYIDEELGKILD